MVFTSITFLIFFCIVYLIYWSISSYKGKEIWLLLTSIIFYATWSIPFLFHFLLMIFLNYLFLRKIYENKSSKLIKLIVVLNLLNLGFFKYFYFLVEIIGEVTGLPLLSAAKSSTLQIILPLAISFYTFQILAFTIDVYRGKFTEKVSFLNYTVFIIFFPQLIAGPIMRADHFIPQLTGTDKTKVFHTDYLYKGLWLVALGVFKKVLIADNIADLIDPVWSNPSAYSTQSHIAAIHGFTWQIYCDFSGYTDIARGCAFLLGYEIPENFRAPFLADSPKDLWQRWHITLSTWLRDYIYIPLGGSRATTEARNYFNLVATFTLGGLWHGAYWTYILWGFFHGVMLALQRALERWNINLRPSGKIGTILSIVFTYHIFLYGAAMFRAHKVRDFFTVTFSWKDFSKGITIPGIDTVFYLCMAAFIIQLFEYKEYTPKFLIKYKLVMIPFVYLLLIALIGLYTSAGKEFVYFQF